MEKACSPITENFELALENLNFVDYILPEPKSLKFLQMNEPLTFFIFFKKNKELPPVVHAKLSLFNGASNIQEEHPIEIKLKETLERDIFGKMGSYHFIKVMEDKEKKAQLHLEILKFSILQNLTGKQRLSNNH